MWECGGEYSHVLCCGVVLFLVMEEDIVVQYTSSYVSGCRLKFTFHTIQH